VLRERPDLHVGVELRPVRPAVSPALASDAVPARLGEEPPEVLVGDRGTEERGTAHPENVFGGAPVQPHGSRPPAVDPALLIQHDQDIVDRDLFKVTTRDVNGAAVPDQQLQVENAGFRRVQLPALSLNGIGQPRHQERDQERGDDEERPRHWLNLRRQPRREERHERGDRSGRQAAHRGADGDHGAREQECRRRASVASEERRGGRARSQDWPLPPGRRGIPPGRGAGNRESLTIESPVTHG
jgi:hypothetical protein